ncbi:MFS transporter, FSR family, fosmidomycin resistance protein [Sphingomonas sp. YR710]|jgi:FSR family fosmidomycin resistance protein-like MFS transporter|uniref:MFS transporter n=1 Tax=Sphingomonas sp. YR710 TaxID=1882773 RepID=UPI00088CA495|nr:MFS transporter [Sphingomonas sp. YR710]SDC10526.1 MFS transporter, FSR family, fosmidomycin resistance protein [Sphingomonas sp. YR710]
MATIDKAATRQSDNRPVFAVLIAISFCHLINDMMQSLLPAIYPAIKTSLSLSFGQIGLVTLVYQVTASILQPLIGLYADRRPMPMALPIGTLFSLSGLTVLSVAHAYPVVLIGGSLLGMGSSVFHPESSRVARMAGGNRHGLAQSLFQVGGNAGQALGPLAAAIVVVRWGQSSVAFFALLALLSGAILWNVGIWYRDHGLERLRAGRKAVAATPLPGRTARRGIAILLALIFSKYVYLSSITSYFTFYLIQRFGLSVQNAQLHLFVFLAAVAVGTIVGGPLGDRFGRKYVIWFSILGTLPFTLMLPHVSLFWTGPLTVIIGLILASAFPAIVVFAQELVPGNVGMISGLFFGFSFGMAGIGAAVLGWIADRAGLATVYQICAFLPMLGLLCAFLPNIERKHPAGPGISE